MVDLIEVPSAADELGRRFADAGHRLHLVGGSVRDALLGRGAADPSAARSAAVPDLDFATDARPERVLALVEDWASQTWTTGITFGTVGLLRRGLRMEITTYRSDAYRPDSRNPVVVYGDTLEGDLVRRDFTVNAMAVSVGQPGSSREFVDPAGGLADLARGVLRTPGPPEISFGDDPLRMLRAVRFVAQLGFAPAPEVIASMTAMAGRLAIISAERVRDELTKTLLSASPRAALELLVDTGLAEQVLPELPALRMTIDEHHQHKDVYAHSLTVLEQAIALEPRYDETGGPDLVLRLAALLHDIGKPRTRASSPGGGVSFHHHEVVGAKLARKRLTALRFPKDVVEDVTELVRLHLRFHGYGTGEWTDSAVRRYVRDAGPLLGRLHALTRSDCTTRNRRKAAALSASYDALEQRIAVLAEAEDLAALRPDLDGNEIMAVLGIPPGRAVGQAWQHLLELRMEHGPLGHDRAVEELRSWAAARELGAG